MVSSEAAAATYPNLYYYSDLIPGLPADVARHCLTRVDFADFPNLRRTCPTLKHELDSASFHSLRKSTSLTRRLIALVHADPSSDSKPPAFRLSLFDPLSLSAACAWHPLPTPAPRRSPLGLPLFCHVEYLPSHRSIAVVGGWDPKTWTPTNEILIFDLLSATWRCGARIPGPRRSLFGCCSAIVGGRTMVVVAGGHDESKDALRSALGYDVERDAWVEMGQMREERDECKLVCLRGEIWAVGGYRTEKQGRFEKSAERFDERRWDWGPQVEEGFLDCATCPRTCAPVAAGKGKGGGEKLMYMCKEGHVAVRVEGEGECKWRKVADLPGDMRAALQVVVLEEDKVVVVFGSGMESGAQLCYVLDVQEHKWRRIEMSKEYTGHVQAASCVEI